MGTLQLSSISERTGGGPQVLMFHGITLRDMLNFFCQGMHGVVCEEHSYAIKVREIQFGAAFCYFFFNFFFLFYSFVNL